MILLGMFASAVELAMETEWKVYLKTSSITYQ